MLTAATQRWRAGRESYRPAGEPIATRLYEVAAIPDDRTAKAFVIAHHYSATYPAARWRVGLYRGGELVGARGPPRAAEHPLRLADRPRPDDVPSPAPEPGEPGGERDGDELETGGDVDGHAILSTEGGGSCVGIDTCW